MQRRLKGISVVRLAAAVTVVALFYGAGISGQGSRRRTEVIDGHEVMAGEVLVRYRSGTNASAQRLTALDVESQAVVANGTRRLKSRMATTSELLASLAGNSDVAWVEPNYVVRADAVPNDPYFVREPGLFNRTWPGVDVHAPGAWDINTGTNANVIALIDSGVDYTHPDLAANIWTAPKAFTVTINGVPITCPAGTHGFNVVFGTCDPKDDYGHGTAMAGVMGASGNNGIGVTGINWRSSIMPLKFLAADGFGTYADALTAMDFALQVKDIFAASGAANIRIMSNSWGGNAFSQALLDEITRASERGMLFVASAGNDAANNDVTPKYPASFVAPSIVSVAATTASDTLESYSNYGAASVDLGAPAATYTTAVGGGYADTGGTSASAALVSGAAALVLSQCDLTVPGVRDTLLTTVDLTAALTGITKTGGRLNVERALGLCRGSNTAPRVALATPRAGDRFAAPASITIAADAIDLDGTVTSVSFYAGTTWIGRDTTAPFAVSWTGVPQGTYTLTAVAVDEDGASSISPALTIVVDAPPSTLPAPWAAQDIGNTGIAGSASVSGGTFTIDGGGADVWGTSDQFRFVYQPLTGDGEIVARVTLVENIEAWTKAGVMIRETLSPSSPHAFMLVSAGKGLAFQRRKVVGGVSTNTSGALSAAPHWVKLRRAGQAVSASVSADGSSWTLVATDTFSMPASVFVGLAVSSHRTGVAAEAVFDNVAVTAMTPGSLPAGWTHADIGAVGVSGSATGSGGSFTVKGAGADVWGTADALHFVYKSISGDTQIIARVATVENVSYWTKAGVMIRASLSPSSAHAFMLVSPGKGRAFQRRSSAGGLSAHTSGGAGVAPVWVKLVRTGQTVTASLSQDGTSWTVVGQDTVALGASAYVGLAVSSHTTASTATAAFDGVAVTQ